MVDYYSNNGKMPIIMRQGMPNRYSSSLSLIALQQQYARNHLMIKQRHPSMPTSAVGSEYQEIGLYSQIINQQYLSLYKYSKILMADSTKNNKTNISQFDQEEFGTEVEAGHDHQRTYGNNIILWRNSSGEPTIVLGPHWYIFMFAFLGTLSLLVLLLYSMQKQLNKIWEIVLAVATVVYAYSYLRIGLSNPGFAQPNKDLPHGDNRLCEICDVRKTMNIYHCPDCNICIEGFDHHCPWIGKCVGHKNLCSFYFFLIMIFATISTAQTSPSSVQHANNDYVVVG